MKNIIKNIFRLLKYKEERLAFFRHRKIKPIQDKLLAEKYNESTKKLVVFFVPGADRLTGKETMSGGVISIVSICEETELIFSQDKDTSVILCTLNGDYLLNRYLNFENNTLVFRFEQIPKYFKGLKTIILHIPDYLTTQFYSTLAKNDLFFLRGIHFVHINIMNQNIKFMPKPKDIQTLSTLSKLTTITTAHQQYCSQYYRDYFGVPLHKFSVWISPEQYNFKRRIDKENLLVYSPDSHPAKNEIINKLKQIDGLRLQMIQNLTYTQYKEVISRAKWSITFGEGLDGYLIEPIFSGAIGFAVYNSDFFTPKFKQLKTIYESYDSMFEKIANDIALLNDEFIFNEYQQNQFNICAELYSFKVYKDNIEKFYNNNFTFK